MGSSLSRIYDDLDEEQWKEDKQWLEAEAERIKGINPSSKEFRDLKWLKDNQGKILRNKRLIEMLG